MSCLIGTSWSGPALLPINVKTLAARHSLKHAAEITPRCGWLSYGSAPDDVAYECGDGKLSDTGVSAEVLNALETICIMVFTVEYVLRILTCTTSMSLVSFIFAPMNVIDLVAILPYYLDLILAAARQHGENAPSLGSARARLELGSCASSHAPAGSGQLQG